MVSCVSATTTAYTMYKHMMTEHQLNDEEALDYVKPPNHSRKLKKKKENESK